MTTVYSNTVFGNVTDMRQYHPGPASPVTATILGPNYPLTEAVGFYVWDWDSLAVDDGIEAVKPIADPYEPMSNGRWLKVDISQIPQINSDWNANSGFAQILNKPTLAPVATAGTYASLTGKPTLSTVAATGSYTDLSNKPTIPAAQVNADWNSVSGVSQILNKPSFPATASQSSVTRSLNTAYQISATRGAFVSYSVQLQVTASISGGQNGDVILEIASDSGFTTAVQTVSISGLGQTYTLAVALQGVQPQTGVVSGFVPAGYYARLRTVSNTGTPSFAYRSGQETLV